MPDPGSSLDISPQLLSDLEQLALACRIVAMEGHASRTVGHLALRDPEGRGLWLKRSEAGLEEIVSADDFVLVDFEGNTLTGAGKRHSEWPIHAEILRVRPDLNVTGHSHPVYGRVFSAFEEPLRAVSSPGANFPVPPPRLTSVGDLIKTVEEGREVAQCLGENSAMFLANHGVVFAGSSIARATMNAIYLEEACREFILARSSGVPCSWPDPEQQRRKAGNRGGNVEQFFAYYVRKLQRIELRFGVGTAL